MIVTKKFSIDINTAILVTTVVPNVLCEFFPLQKFLKKVFLSPIQCTDPLTTDCTGFYVKAALICFRKISTKNPVNSDVLMPN